MPPVTDTSAADTPLFGPGSQFDTFVNDPRWALALVRALVLEAAHPQVGAALLDNSTFMTHPWRRLWNTYRSLRRMFGTDDDVRAREAGRLNRLHARLRSAGAYDATDPEVRAWVVATLFESTVTMCRLSGQPLDPAEMDRVYAEYRAVLGALDGEESRLPGTVREFWPYYDRVVAEELENTEAVRIILYRLFDHVPAPPLLHGVPTLWAAGRAVAGPVIGAVTVASLPEAFRRRAGLAEVPGAGALLRSAYFTAGLARFLPEGWVEADKVVGLLSASPDSDDPRIRAVRDTVRKAGAFVRLVTPLPAEPLVVPRQRSGDAEEFFDAVLDQTGDGYVMWPDLAAMARELSTRLDLDEPLETRLYTAYADWWRELQSALDTDGDGRVSRAEYAAAVPSLAGPALIRVAEVLFDATDTDGDQRIDAEEYRRLFRRAFRRELPELGEAYARGDFVRDFLSFMAGRHRTTPFDPLLAEA
ncbi:oxygenase MpaB family protein [Streptomyces acidiscabies]|uniref:oxygenase MpaB family protein n=1 Tax=Streptomyces acidiscabies TaxID=42234 RepID=UPI0038F6B8E6